MQVGEPGENESGRILHQSAGYIYNIEDSAGSCTARRGMLYACEK